MTAINNKFPENDYFFPPVGESSRLLVGCRREDYSASRIARAVEDCDAHLLNLNVTSMGDTADVYNNLASDNARDGKLPVVFDLRVSHRNPSCITRSLERYGYTVLDTLSDDDSSDTAVARERIDQFFRFLEI